MGYWLDQICDQDRKTQKYGMSLLIKEKLDCNFSSKKRSADEAKPYTPAVSYQRKQYLDEMMQM